MKQIILTLVLFFPLSLMAQEETEYVYQSFVIEGKKWYTHQNTMGNGTYNTLLYYLTGDTIIEGHNCKKLMLNINNGAADNGLEMYYKREDNAYVLRYLYEEDKKVFQYCVNRTPLIYDSHSMLYDFSMKEGDKQENYTVGSVEVVDFHGVKRRVMHIYGYGGIEEYWVEGIGTRSPFTPGYSGFTGGFIGLVECVENDEVVFNENDFNNLVSTDGLELPTMSNDINNDAIYDLQGRRVQTPLREGLYIKNGRKFIQK